ncbi:TPA: prophage tail fiber N-terminal domain-containing protein [Escherichia coli]|nr:prophage tail fiber N-terminal domain-containing protein [Escherichia coli]
MTVKISGVLKDGTGKPVQNCTIVLKARRTSSTVVVNTVASENPDEAGRYSMDVEHGQYSVTLLVEGFPPSHAGTITVYEGSRPGTLNDFLGAMTEDDVRPEALRRFEQMVEEVSRTGSAGDHTHGNGIRWPGGGGSALAFYDGGGFTYVQDSQYQVSPGTSSRRSYYQRIQTQSAGAHTHSLSGTAASSGAHAHTVGIGAHTHSVAIGSHGHTITVNAAGNAENTVKNIAFNYIVRLA